ncbi:MAG: hypothetical protein MZV49_02380 [Rhodopseudomonas palustris]|nr:hypothetical protein [Rhodopseudomonas palustris]
MYDGQRLSTNTGNAGAGTAATTGDRHQKAHQRTVFTRTRAGARAATATKSADPAAAFIAALVVLEFAVRLR